ncbi:MAG: FHA domain-containing protein, partial [Myxococcota bacterium]|nr:FHA domain-containing protein [Myxococcota bacterium]
MSEARQLRFISGKYQGGTYALSEGCEVIMGRGMDAGLTLFEEMVSRHHAKFVVIEGEVSVEDMKS